MRYAKTKVRKWCDKRCHLDDSHGNFDACFGDTTTPDYKAGRKKLAAWHASKAERDRRAKMSLAELSRELVRESDRILGRVKSEATRAKDRERGRINAAGFRAKRKAEREAEAAKGGAK